MRRMQDVVGDTMEEAVFITRSISAGNSGERLSARPLSLTFLFWSMRRDFIDCD